MKKSEEKIHTLSRIRKDLNMAVQARDQLGADLVELAIPLGVEIEFYTFKDDMVGGYPKVFMRCSDEFIEKIKENYPNCYDGEYNEAEQLVKADQIYNYFRNYKRNINKPSFKPK